MLNWILRKTELVRALRARVNELRDNLETEDKIHKGTIARMERLFDQQEAARNVSWPKPAKRLPPPQVTAEFNVPLDRGLMLALHQELDDAVQELFDKVSEPPGATFNESSRLHIAGGIEHMRLFQKRLLDLQAIATRRDADENPESEDLNKRGAA